MQSQNKQILAALKQGKRISPISALNQFGCLRLAARISEHRGAGNDIKTDMYQDYVNGKRYAIYYMNQKTKNDETN